MYLKKIEGPRAVTLPDGSIMTRADLPPAHTTRWVASRKAAVVRAVAYGLMSRDEAKAHWAISDEELDCWTDALARHGPAALKVTQVQRFRQP